MAELIKLAVQGYSNIYKAVKEHAPDATKPLTLAQVASLAEKEPGGIKGMQQVRDAVKSFHKNQVFRKRRDGRELLVWFNSETKQEVIAKQQEVTVKEISLTDKQDPVTVHEAVDGRPEIIVTKEAVTITTQQFRITVEYK